MSGYPYGMTEAEVRRAEIRKECDKKGMAWAKAHLTLNALGMRREYVSEWVNELELAAAKELEAKQLKLAEESIAAAKASADAALESAKQAKESVKATRVAGVFALIAAIAAIGQAVAAFKG